MHIKNDNILYYTIYNKYNISNYEYNQYSVHHKYTRSRVEINTTYIYVYVLDVPIGPTITEYRAIMHDLRNAILNLKPMM